MIVRNNIFNRFAILFVFVLSLIPSTVFAIVYPINGGTYPAQGNTIVGRPRHQGIEVVTQGLQSTVTVDCDGDEECLATGLNSKTMLFEQDLHFLVDETTMTISGEANGGIFISGEEEQIEFTATISGKCFCEPGKERQFDIQIDGHRFDAPVTSGNARFQQMLTATLTSENGEAPVVTWVEYGIKAEQAPG